MHRVPDADDLRRVVATGQVLLVHHTSSCQVRARARATGRELRIAEVRPFSWDTSAIAEGACLTAHQARWTTMSSRRVRAWMVTFALSTGSTSTTFADRPDARLPRP